MKILAFAASNSKASINKQLVTHAAQLLADRTQGEVEILDLNDYDMPLYSIDRQTEHGIHELAQAFFDKIGAADVVLVSFAEHNGSYTAAYKNLFDWASRIDMKVYQGKPSIVLATSPGARGAQRVLESAINSAEAFGMDLKGSLSVPSFGDNFDSDKGQLSSPELSKDLDQILANL